MDTSVPKRRETGSQLIGLLYSGEDTSQVTSCRTMQVNEERHHILMLLATLEADGVGNRTTHEWGF